MKSQLLLWLLLLCSGSAWAQNLSVTESFEGATGTGEGITYTSNSFVVSTTRYFIRASDPVTVSGTQTFNGGTGTMTGENGTYFWACEGVRNAASVTTPATGSVPGTVTLAGIPNTQNYTDLKVTVAAGDPKNSTNQARITDHLRVQYCYGSASGPYITVGEFTNTTNSTGTAVWNRTGTGSSSPQNTTTLTSTFTDHVFPIDPNPGTGLLYVRIEADFNGPNKELAFDNIRVTGTAATSAAPQLGNIEPTALNYNEGAGASQITSTLTVSDADNTTLTGGTIRISSNLDGTEDQLLFTNQNGITGSSFDTSTGVLTLSGTASLAAYQAALRSVRYQNTDGSDASPLTRTISFSVTDPNNVTSNVATRDITVTTALNPATALNPSYIENFDTNGEGTRYSSNTNTGSGQGFVRLTNVSGGSSSPGSGFGNGAATTFTNLQGTGYWYANGASGTIVAGGFGRLTLAPVNTTGFSDLHFKIKAGATTNFGGSSDFLRFLYSTDGTTWTTIANYTNEGSVLRLNGNAANPALGTALADLDFTLPTSLTGTAIQFRVEASSNGGEQIAFDYIQITGTQQPTVTTGTAGSITTTTASISNNTLTADGGANISDYGVVYVAGTGTPTTSNSKVQAGTTSPGSFPASFTVNLTGLAPGTQYTARAYATNSVGTSYGSTVSFTTAAPTISVSPTTLTGGTVAAAYSQTITASGGTSPYSYAITAGALPAGLTLSSAGVLSGTPTAGGSFSFTVTATDASTGGGPYTGARAYTLTIAAPTVAVAPATLSGGTVAAAYSQTITASGGTAPYTFVITAGALPAGLSLSSAGVLSGTPTAGGTFNFTVRATDASTGSGPYTGSRAYTLTIAAPTIAVAPTTLPSGTVAAAYSQTVTASGGTAPYSYAITAGALPAGLSLSSAGVLSGTPTAGGSFTFTVRATDASTGGGPYNSSQTYTLVIAAPTITVAPTTLPSGTVAVAYNQTVTASGGTAPYSYAITAGALPAGLTLSSAGVLSGTPTAGGSFTFTVTATDASTGSGPYTGSRSYTLTIAAPTIAVAPATLPNGATATAYSQTITASGGTAPYSYAITAGALPAGLTLSSAGVLSGTPTAGGSFTFTVTATDASTGSGPYTGSRSYTVTIINSSTTVVSVTRQTPSPTATAQVSYRVTFANSITGVNLSNFTVIPVSGSITGTSVSSVSGSGTTYTVTVNTGTGDGTLRLDVNNTANNISPTPSNVPYTSGEVYTITKSFAAAPTLRIQAAGSASGNGDVTAFVDVVQVLQSGTSTVVANGLQNGSFETNNVDPSSFKKTGDGVTADFWSFTGLSGISRNGSAFGSTAADGTSVALIQSAGDNNASISQNLAVPTGSYQINFQAIQRNYTSLDQRLNVFLVQGGNTVFIGNIQPNNNTPPAYGTFTSATFSVTAPALTATVSTTSASPTSTTPIPFRVSFSQSVGSTFTASDVTVTGGTVNAGSFSGSGSGPYTFTVTPSGAGTVTVSLASGVATDANNTTNSASNSVSVQYQLPTTAAPVVTAPANVTLTNDNTPTYTGTAPAGSTVTVYVDNTAIGTTTATGGNWTLTQPTALADGTHTVNATAQTSGAAVSPVSNTNGFTVDATVPTATITSTGNTNGGSTSTSPIAYTVTFSENVTGFVSGDVTATGGSISNFSGSGTTYTFDVTPSGSGTVTVSVPANVAQDAASNFNTAATQFSITYSQPVTAAPVVTTPANGSTTSTATPAYLGTAASGSTVTVYVDGTSIGTTTATGGNFSLTQPTALTAGSHTVYATAQTSGEAVSANSNINTFTVELAPTVSITTTAGTSTTTAPVPFTVTFSAAVTGFAASDITVTSGTVTNFAGSGTTYTFDLMPSTASGTLTVNVAANVAQSAGNAGNTAATQRSITYSTTLVAWNGSTSADWFTADNWTPNVVPTLTLNTTIPASATRMPTIGAGTASTLAVTIDAGSTLSMSGGTLQANGNWTNNGTFTATGGTVQLGGTASQQILGSSNTRFWNLTTTGSAVTLATSAGINIQRLITTNVDLASGTNLVLLESNASGTAMAVNPNTTGVTGAGAQVQRYISPDLNAGPGYRHLASPTISLNNTQGTMFSDLTTPGYTPVVNAAYNTSASPMTVTPFPNIFGYDQSRVSSTTNNLDAFSKGWVSPSALTDRMTSGYGYTVNLAAGQTVTFKGGLNYGNLARPLTRNATSTTNAADAGWNLMGNPYPSPLDYSLVLAADRVNVEAAIYVYESTSQYGGQYRAYVNGVGGDPVLPMGQAFFARVASGQTSGTITFRNSQRVTTYQNPVYHRTSTTRPLVQLDLQGANQADPLYVYFEQGATAGTDAEFDAVKLPNPTGLNLSAVAGNDEMSINGLPTLGMSAVTVPLQVRVPATGTYTLHAADIVNLPAGMMAYLRDRQTGAVQDLSQQADYTFQLNAAYTGVRFELFFTPQRVLSVAPASLSAQVAVFPNPAHKAVFVELPASLTHAAVTVTLVDALGRSVLTQQLAAGVTTQQLSLENVATGVYAVRLQTAQGTVTKKLTVE